MHSKYDHDFHETLLFFLSTFFSFFLNLTYSVLFYLFEICILCITRHKRIYVIFECHFICNFLLKVLKHKVDNIKRMCAHPLMPLYLTGGQDGSVQMWEWGHQQVVCTPRPPGTFAKVTRCRFSQHGNKFGIADGDGNLSLWQASLASQCNRSFFVSAPKDLFGFGRGN